MPSSGNMFSVYGSSGFYHAPVTKGVLATSILSSFALTFPLHYHRQYFIYTSDQIFQKHQFWRLITSRIFERRFGSRKFASYLLSTGFLATALELLCLYVCQLLEIDTISLPGPLCFVFPMFVPYYFDIPRVAMTTIVGVPVTGKTFTYILGLQIASTTAESRLAALCSIIAGLLWRINFLKIQSVILIPECVGQVFEKTIGRLLRSKPPKNIRLPMGATLELQRQEQLDRLEQQMLWQTFQNPNHLGNNNAGGGLANFFQQNPPNRPGIFGNNFPENLRQRLNAAGQGQGQEEPPAVSEEQVQQLVDMGFNPERVRNALRQTNNDVTSATSVLLRDL